MPVRGQLIIFHFISIYPQTIVKFILTMCWWEMIGIVLNYGEIMEYCIREIIVFT